MARLELAVSAVQVQRIPNFPTSCWLLLFVEMAGFEPADSRLQTERNRPDYATSRYFFASVRGFEPIAYLTYWFYRPAPLHHRDRTPIYCLSNCHALFISYYLDCIFELVGVVEFESTQPKHLFYRQAQLSNVGAPPNRNRLT